MVAGDEATGPSRLGESAASGAQCPDSKDLQEDCVKVSFLGGAEVVVVVGSEDRVADIKRKVAAKKPPPPGRCLRLLKDMRDLGDAELASALAGCSLTAVFSGHELSYRASADGAEVALLAPGDDAYDESLASRAANVDPSTWVPAPEEHPGCRNLAALSAGATTTSSSNIWGSGAPANEKLNNVLRLGARYGDPRFVGGDNSFIFRERDPDQTLTVDLGQAATLVRVGTMCYRDRWLDRLEIDTSTQEVEPREWHAWGRLQRGVPENGVVHFDAAPTEARLVRFRCSSGHYHGAGARLGPVFAYGWAAGEAPALGGRRLEQAVPGGAAAGLGGVGPG
mmetsp:Transcript_112416/g.350324  ORF Transcript_112416/g.350324 Transcript_112416/m.350324 type:complete len:338 (+) Transcript_112416:60-1073(+)